MLLSPDNQYCQGGRPAAPRTPESSQLSRTQTETYIVKRVIDGDTRELEGGEQVRLIGVDTPETKDPRKPVQYFGEKATAFTRRMAEGKRVRLEYDWERYDKYGRTLAYVYLEDGTFLNAEIIRQGYGFAYTRFPFKYLEDFRKLEQEPVRPGGGCGGGEVGGVVERRGVLTSFSRFCHRQRWTACRQRCRARNIAIPKNEKKSVGGTRLSYSPVWKKRQ